MLKQHLAKLKFLPVIFVFGLPFFVAQNTNAASVTLQLTGTPRAATAQEITAMSGPIDSNSTIPARGNVGDLATSGWNVNPNRDLSVGKHELAVVQWQPLTIPACVSSLNVKIDTTIQRKAMDISNSTDSIEWGNALFRGSPSNPEPFNNSIIQEGRYKGSAFGGLNPEGEDVPSNQASDYTVTNAKSTVNTNVLTKEDLANGVFSFVYLDVYSPGPHNISWYAKLNSATVTYEDAQCNTNNNNTGNSNSTNNNAPKSPKTGAMAVAGVLSIVILAGLVVLANYLSKKLELNKKSVR